MNNGHPKPTTIVLLIATIIAVVTSTGIALWRLSIQNQLNNAEKEINTESDVPVPSYYGEESTIPSLSSIIDKWKCGIVESELLINIDGTYSDENKEIFGTYEYNDKTGRLTVQTASRTISYRLQIIGPKLIITDQTHEEECYRYGYGD